MSDADTRIQEMAIDNVTFRLAEPGPSPVSIVDRDRRTLATLHPDGRVEHDPDELDDAARIFWDAVRAANVWTEPVHKVECPSCGATIRARMADAPGSAS